MISNREKIYVVFRFLILKEKFTLKMKLIFKKSQAKNLIIWIIGIIASMIFLYFIWRVLTDVFSPK